MNNENNSQRRKLLIGLGTGLVGATQIPQKWSKPVVDSVLLPAHAETTTEDDSANEEVVAPTKFYGRFNLVSTTPTFGTKSNPAETILSLIVPEAHAGGTSVSAGVMCIDTSNAPTFTAEVVLSDGPEAGLYTTTTGVIGGVENKLDFNAGAATCGFYSTGVSLWVQAPTAAGVPFTIMSNEDNRVGKGILPAGDNCPMKPSCIKT